MKLLKKLLWLGALLTATAGFSVATVSCDDDTPDNATVSSSSDPSSESNEPAAFVYRISVQNETGFGFSGVTVKLMAGTQVVASKKTNASGNANFLAEDISQTGAYTIELEGAPKGYNLPATVYKTSTSAGSTVVLPLTPVGTLLEGTAPEAHRYALGDVMYDFEVNLASGGKYKLSDVLQEKRMVLLNFWATWCTPCKSEFPAMHEAAMNYDDTVSVITVSTTDDLSAAAEYMSSNGYKQFRIAAAGNDSDASRLYSMFSTGSIPHSVMIDRYGVIVYNHVGSMTAISDFTTRFDKLIGDDYRSTVIQNNSQTDEEEKPGSGEIELVKPNVAAPAVEELKSAFVKDASANGFEFRFQEEAGLIPGDEEYDEYNWPWLVSENKEYIYASNINRNNSYAILYSTVTVKADDVLVFDYKVGSEEDCDIFYIMLDGEVVKEYSGDHAKAWNTSYAYVFRDYEAGEHEVAFVFLKDTDKMVYEDVVQLKNLRLERAENLANVSDSIDIFRHAATQKKEGTATTQFANYVDVVLNEEDEYYHVGSKDGPVLYANLMNATPWNETSLWLLAYKNYVVGDGINFKNALEDFAWEATQITTVSGYTPVTEDLKYLLDAAVRYTTYGQKWAGEYHEKEWLELCVYWEHYGTSEMPEDPMKGITFTAAIEMQEGENTVNVPYKINPRGFKYKFTPEKEGVYKVYSTGTVNTQAFLVAEDRKTQLGFWDDKIFEEYIRDENGNDISDGNFEFYWYFEKDTTYYMLFTTYLDVTATYNVNIDWVGEEYTYRTNAAVGPYSANMNTYELYLPDAIDYAYSDPATGGDGYYHHVNKDGSLGSVIYLDVNRPTAFFNTISLYDICRQAENYAPEKRALYINGEDYTDDFMEICFNANNQTGDMKGFAKVDKDIFELLRLLTIDKHEGIEESWLLLCYYDKTLSKDTH